MKGPWEMQAKTRFAEGLKPSVPDKFYLSSVYFVALRPWIYQTERSVVNLVLWHSKAWTG
jgi:hypothetical protein